jgi:hypothetical protein
MARTDKELKEIAQGIWKGTIFTSIQIHDMNDLHLVFLPLIFLNEEQVKEFNADPPGLIFEDLSRAMPRCINGMPVFASMQTLDKEETKKVSEIFSKICVAVEAIELGDE